MHAIESLMQKASIPGLAATVISNDQVLFAEGFGTTAVQEGRPVTPDTLFRIGSVTKPLVATAIMRMVEAGEMDLDCTVATYVSALKPLGPITMRMLLTHSGGLPSQPVHFHGPRDTAGLEQYVTTELLQTPLAHPPGKVLTYSNPGYALAGFVAASVTGQPFDQMMQRLLFDPLAMTRTTLDPLMAATYPLALAHTPGPDGRLRVRRPVGEHTGFRPAGGVFSSVNDLAQFARFQLTSGPADMRTVQVRSYGVAPGGQTIGFSSSRRMGLLRLSHGGQVGGYRSLLVLHPEEQSAVIILANWLDPEQDLQAFRTLLEGEVLGYPNDRGWHPPVVHPDRSRWESRAGAYLNSLEGLLVITAEGFSVTWNGERMSAEALAPDHYVVQRKYGLGFPDDPTLVIFNAAVYHRLPMATTTATFAPRPDHEGEYGLRSRMRLRIVDGQLHLYSDWYRREVPCVPVDSERLACTWGWFSFAHGEDGRVSGIVWAGERTIPKMPS